VAGGAELRVDGDGKKGDRVVENSVERDLRACLRNIRAAPIKISLIATRANNAFAARSSGGAKEARSEGGGEARRRKRRRRASKSGARALCARWLTKRPGTNFHFNFGARVHAKTLSLGLDA